MRQLILLLSALCLWATSAQAAVDWIEGFEYANSAAMDLGGGGPWDTSSPGSTYSMDINTAANRVHNGSKSLKMVYRGHQARIGIPATPGYGSTFKIRQLSGTSATLFTRWWMFIESNFAIDTTSTKVSRHEGIVAPGMWWVFMFGSHALSVAVEGIASGIGSNPTLTIPGGVVPFGQWACVETQITMNTPPGTNTGIIRQWINGNQTINRVDLNLRAAVDTPICPGCPINSPSTVFKEIKIYVQDGVGTMYLDDYAVSRNARIGCDGVVTQPDTTPPSSPTGVIVN